MKCYNCGAKLGRENICPECGVNVKIYKKIVMASNEYYNDALAKASVRDLSGAIESLKTSLKFNKLNIDARNLLGLIYFEMGEVVEALTEWVISLLRMPQAVIWMKYRITDQDLRQSIRPLKNTIRRYCTADRTAVILRLSS